jgi:hypothetical protein
MKKDPFSYAHVVNYIIIINHEIVILATNIVYLE